MRRSRSLLSAWPILIVLSITFLWREALANPAVENIAGRYAPVFLTEAKRYNIPLAVDFDGDWKANNNNTNYDAFLNKFPTFVQNPYASGFSITPTVYYETIETKTHIFLTYYLFFPHDAGDYHTFESGNPRGGHNNDSTSMMVVASKDGNEVRVITQDSGIMASFPKSETRQYHGRPVLVLSSGNHTLRAMRSWGDRLPEELTEDRRKIFLYTHGEDGHKYQLVNIHVSLWPQRANKDLFDKFVRGIGVQLTGKNAPWAPWARSFSDPVVSKQDRGLAESFFDPFRVLVSGACHTIPKDQCSGEYVVNPYSQELGEKK